MARHNLNLNPTPEASPPEASPSEVRPRASRCVSPPPPGIRHRGIATLEFVLILPVFLVLLFGVIEYGWMLTKAGEITNAARDGARVGARADATTADITAAVNDRMTAADLTGYTLTITPAAATGDTLTVAIVQPYDGGIELTNFPLIPVPANLTGTVTMRKEGP